METEKKVRLQVQLNTDSAMAMNDYQIEARIMQVELQYAAIRLRIDHEPDILTYRLLSEMVELTSERVQLLCEQARRKQLLIEQQYHPTQQWKIKVNKNYHSKTQSI